MISTEHQGLRSIDKSDLTSDSCDKNVTFTLFDKITELS